MGCNLDKVQSTEAAGDVQLPSPEKLRIGTSIFELESSKVALWLYHRMQEDGALCRYIIQRQLWHLRRALPFKIP